MHQSIVPTFNSASEIPTDQATFKTKFGTGSYKIPQTTNVHCFVQIGANLNLIPLTIPPASPLIQFGTPIPLDDGTIISFHNNGDRKRYQVISAQNYPIMSRKIWEVLYPIGCRFDLEVVFPGDSFINSMNNTNIRIKMVSNSTQRFGVQVKGMHNSSIYIDSSEYHPQYDSFQFQLYNDNYGAITGINGLSGGSSDKADCITRLGISIGKKVDYSFPRLLEYDTVNITADGATNYWFLTRDTEAYNPSFGQIAQMDYRFEFSDSGLTTFMPVPHMVDYTPEAEETKMTKVRAMSVEPMSLQSEPAKPKVPDDMIGIFSVDEQGNTIDAMTGERI